MAKNIEIRQKSIVIVYPLLDHHFINSNALRKVSDLESDSYGASFVESQTPPLKRLVLPQSKTQIVINAQKVSVFDDTDRKPSESSLIKRYTLNVLELLKDFHSNAYGFNYNVLFESLGSGEKDLLGRKIRSNVPTGVELSTFGTRLVYMQEEVKHDIRIEKIGDKQLSAYLNCHYEKKVPPNMEELDSQFVSNYKNLIGFLEKL